MSPHRTRPDGGSLRSTGAARSAALVLGVLLVAAGTSGCGLRDRSEADASGNGAGVAVPVASDASGAGQPAAGSAGGSGAGGAGDSTAAAQDDGTAAGQDGTAAAGSSDGSASGSSGGTSLTVSASQVAQVESLVGSVDQAVTQGEAEVASDR